MKDRQDFQDFSGFYELRSILRNPVNPVYFPRNTMTDSKPLRVLIVDDEPLARKRLRELLKADSELVVVGECVNGAETLAAARELAPDLIFLDVQMPEIGSMAVSEAQNRKGSRRIIVS